MAECSGARALLGEMQAHDRVGHELDKNDGRVFLSGWNGSHPFVDEILGDLIERLSHAADSLTSYSHMDEDPELLEELGELHTVYGEGAIEPARFVPGAGSSAFLATLTQYLRRMGFEELCYIPPVYYNAIYWIRELGFNVSRVSKAAPLEEDVELTLPRRRTCLWFTDPLWFAGRPVPKSVLDQVVGWQERTGSTVVVDGTFAYMGWNGPRPEGAVRLDPQHTLRLVCPTKALALHGFRFAYTIAPSRLAVDFTDFHGRLHGASSLSDRMFAHRAVNVLRSKFPVRSLWPYVADRYERIAAAGVLGRHIRPGCGYFLFGRVPDAQNEAVALDTACFEVSGHKGHVRINLLDDTVVDYLLALPRSSNSRRKWAAPARRIEPLIDAKEQERLGCRQRNDQRRTEGDLGG
jgi:histidinol-phosphate/aromatic aminotransferase/cobyric acid decarboxylase-like protein